MSPQDQEHGFGNGVRPCRALGHRARSGDWAHSFPCFTIGNVIMVRRAFRPDRSLCEGMAPSNTCRENVSLRPLFQGRRHRLRPVKGKSPGEPSETDVNPGLTWRRVRAVAGGAGRAQRASRRGWLDATAGPAAHNDSRDEDSEDLTRRWIAFSPQGGRPHVTRRVGPGSDWITAIATSETHKP